MSNLSECHIIRSYVQDLFVALSEIPTDSKSEITKEIRSHLEERAAEGQLQKAIQALGKP